MRPALAASGGCFVGPESRLKPFVDDLVRRVGTAPLRRTAAEFDYLGAMRHYAGCDDLGGQACAPGWSGGGGGIGRNAYVGTSRMLTKPLSDPQAAADLLTGEPGLFTIIDAAGGAIGRVGPHESAFPHRAALGSFQVLHDVNASAGDEAYARRAIGVVRDELGKEFGTAGYVNYLDPEMPDWARAYYGDSLPRLRALARKYDPERLFAFPQGLSGT
ncbi:BBE domain-containing protein [Amycolatopsis sp. H20-H5]|uniref:BBE domain-containing protein n=1 Tax=Amycolatopsis sp. H20-H5 TaxID=3046309 RepID=UPI002DBD1221|nr:BBE domain-containing protein [Amycolatopsis sp. H20-H5]MEC3976760.1 BBE domain-containing protein [Amycolatopsis sp. H20-H5]